MEKVKLLVPLAALVMIIPLVSASLRFKYLYLIVNIFIFLLGADAGLLSFLLHRKPSAASSLLLPHKPPITFFIENAGGGEEEEEDDDDDVEDHELYNKSETFIGNFYKQLKMQKEESS